MLKRIIPYIISVALLGGIYISNNSQTEKDVKCKEVPQVGNLESIAPNISKTNAVALPELILQREYTPQKTIGKLYEDVNRNGVVDKGDLYVTETQELPWKQNEKDVSCIPKGTYHVRPRKVSESRKFKTDHFLVQNVPARSAILIHGMGRSEGCIMTPELDVLVKNYRSGFNLSIR